jgi:hypothetical protein
LDSIENRIRATLSCLTDYAITENGNTGNCGALGRLVSTLRFPQKGHSPVFSGSDFSGPIDLSDRTGKIGLGKRPVLVHILLKSNVLASPSTSFKIRLLNLIDELILNTE